MDNDQVLAIMKMAQKHVWLGDYVDILHIVEEKDCRIRHLEETLRQSDTETYDLRSRVKQLEKDAENYIPKLQHDAEMDDLANAVMEQTIAVMPVVDAWIINYPAPQKISAIKALRSGITRGVGLKASKFAVEQRIADLGYNNSGYIVS